MMKKLLTFSSRRDQARVPSLGSQALHNGRPRPRRTAAIAVPVAYFVLILVVRNFAKTGGWAEFDSRNFHFKIINYFLENGFNFDYPKNLIAMFPGMHAFFAAIGSLCGLGTINYDSFAAFVIQSFFGLLLCFAAYRLAIKLCNDALEQTFLLVAILSSSYIAFSWVSPTTELGSFSFYLLMIVILIESYPRCVRAGGFSLLTTASILFRQSSAPLSVALLANDVLQARREAKSVISSEIALGLIPISCAMGAISLVIYAFGGLTPSEFREEHQAGSINPVQIAHLVALTGLLGLPFAVAGWRMVAGVHRTVAAGAAGLLGVFCCWVLPLNFDQAQGRWGSVVWSIDAALNSGKLATAAMWCELSIGFFVWISILYRCVKSRTLHPELLLFALFVTSLLIQTVSWQRYIEFQLIVTLAIAFVRLHPPRPELLLFAGWYAIYLVSGVVKLIEAPIKQ